VVGIGPGSLEDLSPRARAALAGSDLVVGYRLYLDLLGEAIAGKETFASGMMAEAERAHHAVTMALEGRNVAVVSSGDPGIYGMASLVMEVAAQRKAAVEIEVIAGISALNAVAARLGAPLTHDFAVISLSDLLTPLDLILRRIENAAAADFVIVIYNPKSRTRTKPFAQAVAILRKHRAEATPVGIVRNATRADERVRITSLRDLEREEVDMLTTIIVGNSTTYVSDGRMITPRGYTL
jgi:precorrin-3B C17-methyltransferase